LKYIPLPSKTDTKNHVNTVFFSLVNSHITWQASEKKIMYLRDFIFSVVDSLMESFADTVAVDAEEGCIGCFTQFVPKKQASRSRVHTLN